ncbi:MAG: DUF3800 domain-containing protein [bacterium]
MFHFSYFDETGDDGANCQSSELFVLSSSTMPYLSWKDNFQKIRDFRKQLRIHYKFPIGTEIHTKDLLANKSPYQRFGWPDLERLQIIREFLVCISTLDLKIINIVVNKSLCKFPILDVALKFNVQRIENDLRTSPENRFLVITDKGRIGPMTRVCREIQVINPTPSRYDAGVKRPTPIQLLLEDPLEKDSSQSYFIQIADAISFVVYMFCMRSLLGKEFNNRIARFVDHQDVDALLQILTPVFNQKVGPPPYGKYGIKVYP